MLSLFKKVGEAAAFAAGAELGKRIAGDFYEKGKDYLKSPYFAKTIAPPSTEVGEEKPSPQPPRLGG